MPSEERSRGRQAGKREVLVAREQPSPRAVSNAFQNRAHVPALALTMTLCSNLTNYTLMSIPTGGKHISGRVWVSAQCLWNFSELAEQKQALFWPQEHLIKKKTKHFRESQQLRSISWRLSQKDLLTQISLLWLKTVSWLLFVNCGGKKKSWFWHVFNTGLYASS